MERLLISNTTKQTIPKIAFEGIKNDILGKQYELSLTFIGQARAQNLNLAHRNKSYTPNILSFPLDTTVGEIFICPIIAMKEAKNFNLSVKGYVAFLFIHGCLHLKGHDHGDTMERLEARYRKKYQLT